MWKENWVTNEVFELTERERIRKEEVRLMYTQERLTLLTKSGPGADGSSEVQRPT